MIPLEVLQQLWALDQQTLEYIHLPSGSKIPEKDIYILLEFARPNQLVTPGEIMNGNVLKHVETMFQTQEEKRKVMRGFLKSI